MASACHTKDQEAEQKVVGEQRSAKSTILETGAAMTQACFSVPTSHCHPEQPGTFEKTFET